MSESRNPMTWQEGHNGMNTSDGIYHRWLGGQHRSDFFANVVCA